MSALGVRINNPLNLKYRPQDKWDGLIGQQNGECVFTSPQKAFRAYTIQLKHYLASGYDTVPKIIKLWSQTDQAAYTVDVLRWGHFAAAQVITVDDFPALFKGMCRQEDGSDPYPDETITAGIQMALNLNTAPAPVAVHPAAAVVGAGGVAFAITTLLAGAFSDFAHITISADRQAALMVVVTAALHYFFTKGDPAQS